MPFTLEVLDVARDGTELRLRGRISSGAYFGPECVVARSRDGREQPTHIHTHAMEYPEGWPVLPQHRTTVLVLTIPATGIDFQIATLEGLGAVALNANKIDVSGFIDAPEFWALQVALHFTTEEEEDPGLAWLGVDYKQADDWYRRKIDVHLTAGRWPYIRVPLPGSRYIELEMAGGVEYQDRVWIGDSSERVLLGYHSGHFSLPALRPEEVSWIASVTDDSATNLLWLSTAYLGESSDIAPLAERLISNIPGRAIGKESVMTKALLDNLGVEGLEWAQDPTRGWTNNWAYSQRNPGSELSILKAADFAFIRRYFDT